MKKRNKYLRFIAVTFFFPAFFGDWAHFAFSQKAGDNLFNSSSVHYINISFSQPDYWKQLTGNYEATLNKDTNIYIPARIFIDSISLDSIGVRLKGNSTYEHKGRKKPVKLSFDEFIPNQAFDKLKQLNLHNGYFDPTMIREKLMLDFLNKKGIPSPRCTYAEVYFNGDYIGLYKIVEEVDKKFLKTHFGNNDGNLFKGDPSGTLEWKGGAQWDYYSDYDLKTNEKENDWDDLVHFIDVLNNSALADFKRNTDAVFNASPFIRAWAANNLFVNLDSYFFLPHNYYLYHNEKTDRFEWITWDVSVSFGVFPLFTEKRVETLDILYLPVQRHKHPLTYNMLETEDYRKEYLNAVCEFLYNDFTEENLFPEIDSLADIIRPYIKRESSYNQMYSAGDFEKNLSGGSIKKWLYEAPGLKSFITDRRNFAIKRMCELKWSCVKGESIKDSTDRILNIYPNPSTDEITVEIKVLEPESRQVDYKIVNLLGETVFIESAQAPANGYVRTLQTNELIPGIYILSAISGCESYNKKIVVIKPD